MHVIITIGAFALFFLLLDLIYLAQVAIEVMRCVICKVIAELPNNFQALAIVGGGTILCVSDSQFLSLFLVLEIPVLLSCLDHMLGYALFERWNAGKKMLFNITVPLSFVKEFFVLFKDI